MSTQINVRVDAEVLLQRDQVQRQAQRQFVLEKDAKRLVVKRSQELIASSGAAGSENRIRTSNNNQRLPTMPVTAPYKRKPLPQFNGIASTGNNTDSYLALPEQPQLLSQTLIDTRLTSHSPGEALYGHTIKCGKKLAPCYAVYLYEPSPGPEDNDGDSSTSTNRLHRPPRVVNGAWTTEEPVSFEPAQYYTLFFRPKAHLDNEPISDYIAPTNPPTTFTYEAIFMLGQGDSFSNTVELGIGGVYVVMRRELSLNPGDFPIVTIFDLIVASSEQLFFVYHDDNYNPETGSINITDEFGSVPTHVAVTLSQSILTLYVGGVRWFTAPLQSLIGSNSLPTFDSSSFGTNNIDAGGDHAMSFITSRYDGVYGGPEVYSIRYTVGKALYTGESFTPPASITSLA